MIHNLRFVKAMYELEIYRAYYGTIMDKVMVTASDLYFTEAPIASYGPSNLYSLICVEDPFSQIQSNIYNHKKNFFW